MFTRGRIIYTAHTGASGWTPVHTLHTRTAHKHAGTVGHAWSPMSHTRNPRRTPPTTHTHISTTCLRKVPGSDLNHCPALPHWHPPQHTPCLLRGTEGSSLFLLKEKGCGGGADFESFLFLKKFLKGFPSLLSSSSLPPIPLPPQPPSFPLPVPMSQTSAMCPVSPSALQRITEMFQSVSRNAAASSPPSANKLSSGPALGSGPPCLSLLF